MPEQLGPAIYFAVLTGVAIYVWRRGPYALALAYVFFVPWFGLQANIGLTVNLDRFIAAALVLWALARRAPTWARGFGAFLIFISLNTLAQSISLPRTALDFPALQGEWRWLFQILIWGLIVAPAGIIGRMPGTIVRDSYRALVTSVVVLACIAIAQAAVYYSFGVDLLPIGLIDPAGTQRSAVFRAGAGALGGTTLFRAGGLGGEPKHFALSLAVVITVLAAEMAYGNILAWSRRRAISATAVCASALIGTFSTQGLLLAAANVFGVAAGALLLGAASRRRHLIAGTVFLVGIAMAAAVPSLADLLHQRTIGRIEETGAIEDWNRAVLDWAAEHPEMVVLGVGLGNVHLHAAHYVPSEAYEYMAGKVFVAKSGLLRLVSEAGVVGLCLFAVAFLAPVWQLVRRARLDDAAAAAQVVVALCVFADFALSADGPIYVFIVGGLSIAAVRASMEAGARERKLRVASARVECVRP